MVAVAAAGWGTWSLFLRPTGLPAVVTTPILFLVMGVAGIPLMLREPAVRWDRRAFALLAGYTAFDLLNVLAFFSAMNHTTVAVAVLTHYAAPILIALAAPKIDGTNARGTRPAAAVALVTHSLRAAAITLPFATPYLPQVTATDLAYLVTGSILIGTGSGVLFLVGLGRIGSARAAVLTFAEPLVAVCVGALKWAEPLAPIAMLGGVLVLAAGIHVSRQAR